jgi:hypothetical protein
MKLDCPDRPEDWSDAYQGPMVPPCDTARDALMRGLQSMPVWAEGLMRLRNRLARLVGLHGGQDGADMLTRMPVLSESDDRFETGVSDRHLTFTILVELLGPEVRLTTRIWFNHWLGRVYLFVILTFHKAILRHMMRSLSAPMTKG